MAVSVQKFIAPPVFSASPEQDAVDWLERFELAATYNRWSDADHARNFVMYLEGTARKWFLVHNHPNHWEDLPARPNPADPTLPNLPAAIGLTSNPPLKCTKSMDPPYFSHSAMGPKNLK
jgi:hypothetical protein